MSTEATSLTVAPFKSWKLWAVGIAALLWNSLGAFDYLMTQTRNMEYLSAMTPEQLAFIEAFPAWVTACWAIAVWGGVLGAILLLMRKRMAVTVFLVAFVAMALSTFHNLVLSNGLEVYGGGVPMVMTALIFVIALALWLYARSLERRGVLG